MKKINISDCKISIIASEATTPISEALSLKETGADHRKYIKKVQKDDGLNVWLWCDIEVHVRYNGFIGSAYLSNGAYKSEQDFIKNSGYYEDLLQEALNDLQQGVLKTYERLKPLLETSNG